jgi:hypothetical protein
MQQKMTRQEIRSLLDELDHLKEKGHLTPELQLVREQLLAAEAAVPVAATEGAR